MDVAQIIAAFAALLTAVGAVFAGLSWRREHRRDRRVVKVACTEAWGSDDYGSEAYVLRVIATNEGHRPVEIVRVFFRTRAGRELPVPEGAEPKLPALLGDGESVTIDVLAELVQQAQRQVGVTAEVAVVLDASGNEYSAPRERY